MQGTYPHIKAFMRFKVILVAFLVLGCLATTAQARQSFYFLASETVRVYSMDGVFQESFRLNPYPESQQGYRGFTTDANGLSAWTSHLPDYDFITGQAIRSGGTGGSFPIDNTEWGYTAGVAVNGDTLYLGRYQYFAGYQIERYSISSGAYIDQWNLSNFFPDLMQYVDGYLIVGNSSAGKVRIYDTSGSMQGEFDVSYLYPGNGLTTLSADSDYIYIQYYVDGINTAFAFDWAGNRQAAHDVQFPGLGMAQEACIAQAPDVQIIMPDAASIDFGLQVVDTQSDELLTITNVGVENLTVTGITLSDTTNYDFSAPGMPFTLAPGESEVITISFTPQTTGQINAELSIFSNSQNIAGSELIVGLTGKSLASVVYVDALAAGTENGSSWSNAFTSIADAIASGDVLDGGSIWVREGTCSLEATILVDKAVSIFGGFPRDIANPVWSDRDWENHATIIDGNAAFQCVRITASATIDGFTITNGRHTDGSAIYNSSSVVTIENCTISDNTDTSGGGAVHAFNADDLDPYTASTIITNCTFVNNYAGRREEPMLSPMSLTRDAH